MLAFYSLPVVYLNFMTQSSCMCTNAMHMSHKANLGLVVVVLFSECPPLFSQPCIVLCCEPHCLTGKRMLVPQRTLHLGEMTGLNTGKEGDESRKHSGVSQLYISLLQRVLHYGMRTAAGTQCSSQSSITVSLYHCLESKVKRGVFILNHSICLLWVRRLKGSNPILT